MGSVDQDRPLRIVLPGGSGSVGALLAGYFQERGHNVTVLTRAPYTASWQTVHWDAINAGPWVETLEGADVCINLTGRPINCRYTEKNKRDLYDSRIGPTLLLNRVIADLRHPPRVWLNTSAATIYRHALDRDMDEATGEMGGNEWIGGGIFRRRAPRKWGWIVGLVRDWERAFFSTPTPKTRKVALRTSLVMSPTPGTVFAMLSRLARVGLGGTQGNGRQYVSWIHESDYARAVEFLIERDDIDGPVNMASPRPLPNRDFLRELRQAWEMPNGIWAPAPLLSVGMFLLRSEPELILKSRRVAPGKLHDAGFAFDFPTWAEAAKDLVSQWRAKDLGF
jgi:NAD dependent epimerase/dehydratase family enzyme